MNHPEPRYVHALTGGAASLGIGVSPELAAKMAQHHALVVRWAAKINLTTVLEPERAAILHGLDSLLFAEVFGADEAIEVVDVGSGAGFPGIVLALARPRISIALWEPVRKKASFLRVALAELAIAGARVVERRLESVQPGKAAAFATAAIVSRATVPPLELVALAAPYLRDGGRLVVSGGQGAPATEALLAASGGQFAAGERREWVLPSGERRVIEVLLKRP